ncbi:bifunctional diguanylate cyclase/phosphodiesterase [Aureimonas endophytica]|uniref:Bifunctional diguanylate cyclase/phosphodiesterase n=1 Tax=Aureimonas endophytica TaxID=2027858 RepID=A0A917A313_9HYPH|nr:EAL domain-containing protein [Aureimonas endophytica]GGE22737.1 bifunctional diguanylate cyclase/phosphodiesterase [Aureimonas endophytica]
MTFKTGSPDVLKLLSRHAGVGLFDAFIVDGDPFHPDSRWAYSAEYRRLVGHDTEAGFPDLYQSWRDRLHADDVDAMLKELGRLFTDTAPVTHYDVKFRLRHADGSYRWFRGIGGVVHDALGMPTRMCGSLIDIQEGEAAAAEIRRDATSEMERLAHAHEASRNRFLQIAAAAPDGICCTDEAGIVTFWNDAAERLHGIPRAEILGRPVDRVTTREIQAKGDFLTRAMAAVGGMREYELLDREGRLLPVELSTSSWLEGGRPCFGFITRDARERKAREARLAELARTDPLTGLPNRPALTRHIAAIEDTGPFAVLMIDLDGFKEINDALGHESGDAVLKVVSARMLATVVPDDVLARFGGDEFALVVAGENALGRCAALAEALIAAISRPIPLDEAEVLVGASIGIATAPDHGTEATELLSSADSALYAAKREGRGRFRYFAPELRQAAIDLGNTRRQLRAAVERGEFELFYQPQYRLADRRLIGAEALLRWRHPEKGLMAPAGFLPVLEKSPLSMAVGDWILWEACRQAAEWRRRMPDFRIAANLFASQLRDPALPEKVARALAAHDLPAEALELELPETVQLSADAGLKARLADLKTRGLGIAFDDYGTGYASFASLRDFPLTRLKIDRSFVQGMIVSGLDAAVVEAILLLGRRLGVSVIAEGVETMEQELRLGDGGCLEGQGYLFGRPAAAGDFAERFLAAPAGPAPLDRPAPLAMASPGAYRAADLRHPAAAGL